MYMYVIEWVYRLLSLNPNHIIIIIKFDIRIRLWTPFLCAKFEGDRSTRFRFIAICASVRKHEENNRNFGSSYLRNGFSDFHQIWNVDPPGWRATL